MDGFDISRTLENRGIELILVGADLVVRPIEKLTTQDRELVTAYRDKVVFACQIRDGQIPVSRFPKAKPDPTSPGVWCVPKRVGDPVSTQPSSAFTREEMSAHWPPTNGNGKHPTTDPPIEVVTPAANAFDGRPAAELVEEAIAHLRAWRNGGTSASRARALAHLALSKLTTAVGKCERDADFFQISSLDIGCIMKVAEQLLVRNFTGDGTQWGPEHLTRLRERLEAGHQLVDWCGPMAQPRLQKPDGTIYTLFRTDG